VEKCRERQATDNTVLRMRCECSIAKATDIHSQITIKLTAFPRQRHLRKGVSMLTLYVDFISCVPTT